ncbi:MAG: spore cortex biosynthesis protein YabQ [Clostridium sp.]|uniref:spore cortex biosynthesis protein YabQ n=1 Tax=Clostridium sp. TaxID=1506 RepID=UPI003F2ABF2E
MPLSTGMQINMVFYSIVAGFILGSLFDVYRIIRGKNVLRVIAIVEDILFWILSGMIVFTFLLYNNFAFLGPYVYVFIFSGLICYLKLLSRFIYKAEVVFVDGTWRIIRIGYKNISYPIRLMYSKTKGKK